MRRVILLLAAAGAIACAGNDITNSVPRGVTGTYALTTVNGSLMPLLIGQNDTASLELTSGSVALNADGSFMDIVNLRLTNPSGVKMEADTIRGVFTRSGTTIMFEPGDATGAYFMEVTDEHTLTESDPGLVIVYKRD